MSKPILITLAFDCIGGIFVGPSVAFHSQFDDLVVVLLSLFFPFGVVFFLR